MTAPMTLLQQAQRLRREVGANGTGPDTTVGLSPASEYQRLVDWLITADEDVQRRHDNWRFMVGSFSINTQAGKAGYLPSECITPVTDLREWKDRTIKCYRLSAGVGDERFLNYLDLDMWDALYNTGTISPGTPEHWAVGENDQLLIGPVPNDVYRITGKYQRTVTQMTADASVPIYPAEYHMLPVYAAMMEYGTYTAAMEVYMRGQNKFERLLRQMERTQLPRLNAFVPLA